MHELIGLLLVAVIINLLMFIPAFVFKTDKLTDISYSLSFIVLGLIGYFNSARNLMQQILLAMVIGWAARLGVFLLIRIWHMKRDKRFDEMRGNFLLFLRFWLLQGISVFVVLIAAILLWQEKNPNIGLISLLGIYVFAAGLALESTADLQKYKFNKNPKNKNQWIDKGLWSVSRHPNYLGEMLVWIGAYIYVVPSLSGNGWLLALLSPAYICTLLLFISGIPLLEKSADKRWGANAQYKEYKKKTSVLIPKIY